VHAGYPPGWQELLHAPALGEELVSQVNHRGIVAAGCPIGDPDFVAEEAMTSASKVESLVNALTNLELPVQDQLLLMRKSLQAKVAHYARCGQFQNIQEAWITSEHAISQAILQIIGRKESMVDMEQMWLPIKKGGLGIQYLTALDGIVCKTGSWQPQLSHSRNLPRHLRASNPSKGSLGSSWKSCGSS
jgi:hypothetical protein